MTINWFQVWPLTVAWGPRSPSPLPLPFPGWSFSMGSALPVPQLACVCHRLALPCASSVVALTFMPSPRFLLEVTFIITQILKEARDIETSSFNPRRACLPLQEVHFPFLLQNYEGLVSWRHSFNNQHVKVPHGLKALMFLLKQVVSLREENVPYCL